jgi:serine protease Do
MKAKTVSCFILYFIWIASITFADIGVPLRVWPYPITESVEVLSQWFKDHGFELSRISLDAGSFQLKAAKGEESWQVILRPCSPLATEVKFQYTREGQPDEAKIEELRAYLKHYNTGLYEKKEHFGQTIPAHILSYRENSVCIEADLEQGHIQFSGVIIDEDGLIISTAHDLKGVKNVTVTMNTGQQNDAYLIAADFHRDLALIKINSGFKSWVSLTKGRNFLRMGEKIYAISCPNHQSNTFHSGVIIGPPRRANDLPLWQVSMSVFQGNSGSPVFDEQGNLVGIVKGRYRGTDSIGFLIPLETILEFLKEIKPL